MISSSVLAASSDIRHAFQTAKPFKHTCIDNFLIDSAAEEALKDFPVFDRSKAINEFGEVGRKAVNPNLKDISPFYAKFYDWLFSTEFLSEMSELTGIAGLIGDPTMYGGGTHENLHGQELDPHVDFNYVSGGQAHRRVNLLVYLNKDWQEQWGGALEVHSNPREPDTNVITPYNPIFNRAIMFETNEYSWHGFPRVNLPEHERGRNSRKCLSIYLYTRDRPADEIAGTHGTFYVQRPLNPSIQPGHTLTAEDVDELRRGFRNRDRSIEAYQKLEERLGRERDGLHRYLDEIVASVRLPTVGAALQLKRLSGIIWHDGWISRSVEVLLEARSDIEVVELHGSTPEALGPGVTVTLSVDGGAETSLVTTSPSFVLASVSRVKSGDSFRVRITSSAVLNMCKEGKGSDDRDLAIFVTMLRFR